jgi:hypothetical protein
LLAPCNNGPYYFQKGKGFTGLHKQQKETQKMAWAQSNPDSLVSSPQHPLHGQTQPNAAFPSIICLVTTFLLFSENLD